MKWISALIQDFLKTIYQTSIYINSHDRFKYIHRFRLDKYHYCPHGSSNFPYSKRYFFNLWKNYFHELKQLEMTCYIINTIYHVITCYITCIYFRIIFLNSRSVFYTFINGILDSQGNIQIENFGFIILQWIPLIFLIKNSHKVAKKYLVFFIKSNSFFSGISIFQLIYNGFFN